VLLHSPPDFAQMLPKNPKGLNGSIKAASPNRRLRFAFAICRKFDYCFCVPPLLSAAVGEPQRSM
jgi:hypothetical protein